VINTFFKIRTLKGKIFFTIFIFFLLFFLFAFGITSKVRNILLEKELSILNTEYYSFLSGYEKSLLDTSFSLAASIATDKDLKDAFLKRDIKYIKKKYSELEAEIQTNTNFKDFEIFFYLKGVKPFFNVLPPDMVTESYLQKMKNLILNVEKNNRFIKSFIVTSNGLAAAAVYPLVYNSKLIGSVGVSIGLGNIKNIIKDANVIFLIKREYVPTEEILKSYPIVGNYVIIGFNSNAYLTLLSNIDLNKISQIYKSKFIYIYPLYSFNGEEIGRIVIIKDISNLLYDLDKTISYINLTIILLFFFAVLISNVGLYYIVTKPISNIIEKFEIVKKEYSKYLDTKSHEKVKDEILKLTIIVDSLITLLNNLRELDRFRKAIENDETLEDVLNRIRNLIEKKFRFDKYAFYMVDEDTKKFTLKFLKGYDVPFCNELINNEPEKCRAVKTSNIIISYKEFPNLCKYFCCYDKYHHICIPLFLSGKLFALIQLVADKTEDVRHLDKKINLLVSYLRAALPIIEAKLLMKKIHDRMVKDTLTGCYNRIFLHEFVERQIPILKKYNIPLGILLIDIDDFKKVNDTYGHDIGDIVLKSIAETIRKSVTKNDYVIRYGGEEFLVLLYNCEPDKLVDVAERIRKNVEKLNIVTPIGVLKKTVSIGAAHFPTDSEDFWKCVKYADIALYKAKNTGKNKVVRFSKDLLKEIDKEEDEK